MLDCGLVPVLHGDAVLDRQQGSAIVSGDMILDSLCASLSPTAAVFLTDVPGVRAGGAGGVGGFSITGGGHKGHGAKERR